MTACNTSMPSLAAACAACQGDDPCLPCSLTASGDAAGLPLLARRRVRRGEALFRDGDPCRSVYVVRSGTFKSVLTGPDGHEQVTGFQLAGDLLGLDGLAHGRYASAAIALEDSEAVVLPYARASLSHVGDLHELLPRLLGRELVRKQKLAVLLACMSAEQRLASFLLNLSRRLQVRGYSATGFHLRMSRAEIGSYLGLTLETVSRTLSALQERGLLRVSGRHVELVDRPALVRVFGPPSSRRRGAPAGILLHA
jgi:CRP/FNR family transcriptional regulator, anaerobic regulatory protein